MPDLATLKKFSYGGAPNTFGHVDFLAGLTLARGRVHEFCGPARHTLAMMAAGANGPFGPPILWITHAWHGAQFHPEGMARFVSPARLILVRARRTEDMLWAMEEALRAGVVPLVVADFPTPPASLTHVRRLHLAAESVGAGRAPLGLILTPAQGGAPGVESRWHLAPRHSPGQTGWRLQRCRARMAPQQSWDLRAHPQATGQKEWRHVEQSTGSNRWYLHTDVARHSPTD